MLFIDRILLNLSSMPQMGHFSDRIDICRNAFFDKRGNGYWMNVYEEEQ